MFKIFIAVLFVLAIVCLMYWLVVVPKISTPQLELEARTEFKYKTALEVDLDSAFPEVLYLRRVLDSVWQTSGEHTNYALKEYQEASMSITIVKADAYLKKPAEDLARILIGRVSDRGSGMHGWHVTMVKQGEQAINFARHQRYRVWIEKTVPSGFSDNGEPRSDNPERWYFAGLADLIAEEHYQGYVEPLEEQ